MKYRCLVLFSAVTAVVAVASSPMAGQAPRALRGTAATAWGDPDLHGIWVGAESGLALERPAKFGGREFKTREEVAAEERIMRERNAERLAGTAVDFGFRQQPNTVAFGTPIDEAEFKVARRTSAIIDPPDGRIPPWTPEQMKRYEAREAASEGLGESYAPEERGLRERCFESFPAGQVPAWGLGDYWRRDSGLTSIVNRTQVTEGNASQAGGSRAGGRRQILQVPGYVAFAGEDTYQIVPLGGRPKLGPKIQQWSGSSRGHWEGKTLVIETANIIANAPVIPTYDVHLYPGSGETLHVTERYTLVDVNTLEYRYTIDDPETYTRPYTVRLELRRDESYPLAPTTCHEKNDMPDLLAFARADEEQSLEYQNESKEARRQILERLKAEWAKGNKNR